MTQRTICPTPAGMDRDSRDCGRAYPLMQDAPDEAFSLTEAVAAEIDRRMAKADAHPGSGATWDEVYARITDPARRPPPRS